MSAFLLEADAQAFAVESGGQVASFKDLLQTYAYGPQPARISQLTIDDLRQILLCAPSFCGLGSLSVKRSLSFVR